MADPSAHSPSIDLAVRDRVLRAHPTAPLIMGILNASPESFSSDGDTDLRRLTDHARRLVDAGADIVDIGGESGVTNRAALEAGVESRRVVPLVEAVVALGAVVSVDTWKPAVARDVLAVGAHLINDVSGLRDPAIAMACAEVGAGLVVMHTRAEPKVKAFPAYTDVVDDVVSFLAARTATAESLGVRRESIVIDPGPDFAKTPAQTVDVLRALPALSRFERPILLAVSRKDFVGAITGRMPRERQAGTLAAIGAGLDAGASIIRVHDVEATIDYLKVRAALLGYAPVAADLALAEHLRREPTGAGD